VNLTTTIFSQLISKYTNFFSEKKEKCKESMKQMYDSREKLTSCNGEKED
jgi:hypothetical protein